MAHTQTTSSNPYKYIVIYTHAEDPYFEGHTLQYRQTLENTCNNGLYAKMIVSRAKCRGDLAAFWRTEKDAPASSVISQ